MNHRWLAHSWLAHTICPVYIVGDGVYILSVFDQKVLSAKISPRNMLHTVFAATHQENSHVWFPSVNLFVDVGSVRGKSYTVST